MQKLRHFFLHDDHDNVTVDLFDSSILISQNKVDQRKPAGRGEIIFFSHNGHDLVLRHYRRGGLPAQISKDRYLWMGIGFSRSWREYQLLKWMQSRGLPVPRVFAAHVAKCGLFYTADLITHCLANTQSLGEALQARKIPDEVFSRIGKTIRHFHNEGVDHVDLNVNNILLDNNGAIYLIDFDRCRVRADSNERWKQENLSRLQRSFIKLRGQSTACHFTGSNWDALKQGYEHG